MPLTVEYASFEEGVQFSARGFLHGIEYETQNSPLEAVHDHDVPCAVCLVQGSTETLMIPGTLSCPVGWRSEYTGYLVSSMALRSLNMTLTTQQQYQTMFECLEEAVKVQYGAERNNHQPLTSLFPLLWCKFCNLL